MIPILWVYKWGSTIKYLYVLYSLAFLKAPSSTVWRKIFQYFSDKIMVEIFKRFCNNLIQQWVRVKFSLGKEPDFNIPNLDQLLLINRCSTAILFNGLPSKIVKLRIFLIQDKVSWVQNTSNQSRFVQHS